MEAESGSTTSCGSTNGLRSRPRPTRSTRTYRQGSTRSATRYYEQTGGATARLSWVSHPLDRLLADGVVPPEGLTSENGSYHLIYQNDGNLVLYTAGWEPVWATGTNPSDRGQAIMQADGNFVVYDAWDTPLFDTGTCGNSGAYLVVQNDGNLVIFSAADVPLWSIW